MHGQIITHLNPNSPISQSCTIITRFASQITKNSRLETIGWWYPQNRKASLGPKPRRRTQPNPRPLYTCEAAVPHIPSSQSAHKIQSKTLVSTKIEDTKSGRAHWAYHGGTELVEKSKHRNRVRELETRISILPLTKAVICDVRTLYGRERHGRMQNSTESGARVLQFSAGWKLQRRRNPSPSPMFGYKYSEFRSWKRGDFLLRFGLLCTVIHLISITLMCKQMGSMRKLDLCY